ncbi:MAG TPA: hypothetical protein VGL92_05700 [Acidimicrobiia bacterium]|jgi:hypothetical protein
MRAKVAVVVLVAFGLLGAVVITASAADRAQVASDAIVLTDTGNTISSPVVPMDRGHDDSDSADDGGDRCVAEDEVLVGPVCVAADIITVELEDILTT